MAWDIKEASAGNGRAQSSVPTFFKQRKYFAGDIKLGALFPIHKRSEEGDPDASCGKIQREDGIQPLEAMLFTLDEINASNDLLPGIK